MKISFSVGGGIGNRVQTIPALALLKKAGHEVTVVGCDDDRITPTLLSGFDDVSIVDDFTGTHFDKQIATAFAESSDWERDWSVSEVESNMNATGLEWDSSDIEADYSYLFSHIEAMSLGDADILIHNGYNKTTANPLNLWEAKSYPYWNEVVSKLKQAGYRVASIGSTDEYIAGTINLTGITIADTIAVMKSAKCVIANDTGTYHLANLLAIPNVVIFTFTDDVKNFDPRFHRHSTIVSARVECSPCQFTDKHPYWVTNKERCGWKCRRIDSQRIVDAAISQIDLESRVRKKVFFGITTLNRLDYLKNLIEQWDRTRSREFDWVLAVSDDGSTDGTVEYLESIDAHIIHGSGEGVHEGTNKLLSLAVASNIDFGFKVDDDIELLRHGWDIRYIDAASKTGYKHLVKFDGGWDNAYRDGKASVDVNGDGISARVHVRDCLGAFWTFTTDVIKDVGYFDVDNFGHSGLGHTDYSWRCCRAGYNVEDMLFDVSDSDKYVRLIVDDYSPAVEYGKKYLRSGKTEDHKWSVMTNEDRMKVALHSSDDLSDVIMYNLSVIVSSYNQADTIRKFLQALVKQTVMPLEVIVADDGSMDRTFDVIVEEASNCPFTVRYVSRDHNGYRLSSLWNMGARLSVGDRLLFTNADVLHEEGSTEAHSKCQAEIGGGMIVGITKNGEIDNNARNNRSYIDDNNLLGVWGGNFSITADKFRELGGFDEGFNGWGGEDADLAQRCLAKGGDIEWVRGSVGCHLDHPIKDYARESQGSMRYLMKQSQSNELNKPSR